MHELCTKGAGELAGLIASGQVKSAEVVDAYLARIKEVNPDVNAVTVTLADEARAAAAAATQRFWKTRTSAFWPWPVTGGVTATRGRRLYC